jgi:predicted signal transduction protein with EAL and GGDEF domain
VGIAIGPANGTTTEQLMKNADLALYRAKGEGRGTFRLFEEQMDAEMQRRCVMERELRQALVEGQFELHYQPQVNLARNQVCGFEALLRWRHPAKGMVAPDEFIPFAEESGFIVPLGEWVMRQACATAASWPDDIRIAVNVSPKQLVNPTLVQVIASALGASGLSPRRLEVEITETALLTDNQEILATLTRLRKLGVRIAVDDFGIGFSSLNHLRRFRFDKVKIDRSFVESFAEGGNALDVVRAVALLARGLGIDTTAEGVETQAQLEGVKAEGCTEMQGFHFSRPLPASQIEQLYVADLRQGRSRQDMYAA